MYGLWTTTTTGEGLHTYTQTTIGIEHNIHRSVGGGGEIINCFGFAESGGFGGVKRAAV